MYYFLQLLLGIQFQDNIYTITILRNLTIYSLSRTLVNYTNYLLLYT